MNKALKGSSSQRKITLVVMIATYLPFLVFANLPDSSSGSLISYTAAQTGYLATVLLLWQFVLGTRSVSAFWLKDQAWAINLHKKIATYGIALVILHPFLIAYSYIEGLDFIFALDFSSEAAKNITYGRIAFWLFLVVWFSSAILRANIGYRPWKYIHYLTYIIMPLVLLHIPEVGSFYAGDAVIKGLWTAMAIVFVLMLVLRLGHLFTFNQYTYELLAKKEVGKDIFLYKLKPLSKKLVPQAGQYVYVRRGFWSEDHPFSVAQTSEVGEISIAAKVFGSYTKKLSQSEVGSLVYLDGPYGVFTKEVEMDPSSPATFIAGGIGITPFIQHIVKGNKKDITLFSANRAKQFVVFAGLFKKMLGERYIEVFSQDEIEGAEHGFVNAELIKKYLGDNFKKQQFYICGPAPMMSKVSQSLLDAGISKDSIHTEEFGF